MKAIYTSMAYTDRHPGPSRPHRVPSHGCQERLLALIRALAGHVLTIASPSGTSQVAACIRSRHGCVAPVARLHLFKLSTCAVAGSRFSAPPALHAAPLTPPCAQNGGEALGTPPPPDLVPPSSQPALC